MKKKNQERKLKSKTVQPNGTFEFKFANGKEFVCGSAEDLANEFERTHNKLIGNKKPYVSGKKSINKQKDMGRN